MTKMTSALGNNGKPIKGGKGKKGKGRDKDKPKKNEDRNENYSVPGRMVIHALGKKQRIIVPYAPRAVTYSNIGNIWSEVPREGGRVPLLVRSGKGLPKIGFELWIGYEDWERPVMHQLNVLRNFAGNNAPLIINWSSWERGVWRITSITVTSEQREPDTNEITRATVNIEFTRIRNVRDNRGPASGGKDDKDEKKVPNRYKVKKGDTLMKIGMRFYGNHRAWRRIAKKNKINNPRKTKKLKPGKILRMP